MNARFHPAGQARGATAPYGAVGPRPPYGPGDQACCCVARPVVRVVLPSAPDRPHETDLLLCGHHYRVSRDALAAAHARVEELPASRGDLTAWFDGGRDRSAHVSTVVR